MLYDGMIGRENDFSVGRVFIQGEGRYRTDRVTHGNISNTCADSIDDTGGIISQTRREYWRFDIFVVAPHRIGPVDADCFYIDPNVMWTWNGNLRFDELQD